MTAAMRWSACPHDCPSTCALEIEVKDERTIGRVRGSMRNPYTAGVICAKVARYAERVHHPDRLKTPLLRTGPKGSNQFKPISWDEALDRTAAAFLDAERLYGAESIWPYYYAGTMGLLQRDGINRLRHMKRYSGQKGTICTALAYAGYMAGMGDVTGVDPMEMADTDLLVIWGTNAVHTQVNVITHATRARRERGAKIICVDPYRNATAEFADIHVMPRPGTDGALACAVMHILFRDGYADWDYLDRHTDHPRELEAHLKTRTPEWAARITGLAVEEIESFAALYGRTERALIKVGYGLSRQRNGSANMHAITCLPAVRGAWRHKGGGLSFVNGRYFAKTASHLIKGTAHNSPSLRELDMCHIGDVLLGDARALKGGPPVMAMLIQNTNPMVVAPESAKVAQGFARDDLFVAVHEQFMTDTARMADIVMPATTFVEHDDYYRGGGHFTLQAGPRLIEPLGDARENHFVICELAKRLGLDDESFYIDARDLINRQLAENGLPDFETLDQSGGLDMRPSFEDAHCLNGFPTPDGKFHFAPDWSRIGPDYAVMPRLPDHFAILEETDADHPYRLVTAPARNYLNSSFTETPTSQKNEGRPTVMVHPDDAAALGLADGQAVRLGNHRGQVQLHAKLFDGLPSGVLVVESLWPNSAFPDGRGINTLVGADAPPPNSGAAFHDTAVWMRAL